MKFRNYSLPTSEVSRIISYVFAGEYIGYRIHFVFLLGHINKITYSQSIYVCNFLEKNKINLR